MLRAFLMVGIGGFFGSMTRYGVSLAVTRLASSSYPLGTFVINISGCFLLGLLFGLGARNQWLQGEGWLILASGFCGGFTTFSTFALENMNLFQKGASVAAIVYTCLSVILGILLCKAGIWLAG